MFANLIKKSSPKGCYNLRQRIREISGSSQKKSAANQHITEEDSEYCSQYIKENRYDHSEHCQLCLQESSQTNSSESTTHKAATKNAISPNTDHPESPSILLTINAATLLFTIIYYGTSLHRSHVISHTLKLNDIAPNVYSHAYKGFVPILIYQNKRS